jgi:hypothetical protein
VETRLPKPGVSARGAQPATREEAQR